jgi:kynurenine formamidase
MKTHVLMLAAAAIATAGLAGGARTEQPVQLKFSRVVDLTLPVETDMAGIPLKIYTDNPVKVDVISALTDAQTDQLRTEGMLLDTHLAIGRPMLSKLTILTHNGTHVDAPRHVLEKGLPIDQFPLRQVAHEGVLIDLTHKGPNASISAKDILDSGVELNSHRIPVIHTGWTEKMWGRPEFWTQMPYLETDVGPLMVSKGVPAVALDVFPEKPIWRGVKLEPGEVWLRNHHALLSNGIPLIQFVTNLSEIGANRFVLVALPLKLKGADGGPARVVALVE